MQTLQKSFLIFLQSSFLLILLAGCGSEKSEAQVPTMKETIPAETSTIPPTNPASDPTPTPTEKPLLITNIVVDGLSDDWMNREIILDDPLGDGEQGFLDFRAGYAFLNQHALYFLVNVEDVNAPFVLFDMNFSTEDGHYQITWSPGQAGLSLGFYGKNGDFVDLGFIERTSFAYQDALEARIDLRDFGSDITLNSIFIMAMVGEGESWGPADTWTTSDPLPVVDEVDPPMLVSEEAKYALAKRYDLPEGYLVEILHEGAAPGGYLARSQEGIIYQQHSGQFPHLSVFDPETASVSKIADLPSDVGLSIIAGGPGDTVFINVAHEIRQYSPDGNYQLWGASPDAFILDYSDEIGLIGRTHDNTSVVRIHPDGSLEVLADGLAEVLELEVLPGGDIVLNEVLAGRIVLIDQNGIKRTLVDGELKGEGVTLKLDPAGNLYWRSASGFFLLDTESGVSKPLPVDFYECSWNPGDFEFVDENHIIIIGDQIRWADINTGEVSYLIENLGSTFAADLGTDEKLYIGVTGCNQSPPSRILRYDNQEFTIYVDDLQGTIRDLAFSDDGGLFVAIENENLENQIYYLPPGENEIELYADLPQGSVASLAVDPNSGHALVAMYNDSTLYEFDITGESKKHLINYPLRVAAIRLAFNPSGILYALVDTPDFSTRLRTDRLVLEVDLVTGETHIIADVSLDGPGGTMNVMNVDSQGIIWVITNPDSIIYRITPTGDISVFAQNTPIDIPAIDITGKVNCYST